MLSSLLSILPLKISCCFSGRSFYYPEHNQLVLIWMTCHKDIPRLVYAGSAVL